MLDPTEEYARFDDFRRANSEAKYVASLLREDVSLVRDGEHWVLLVPPGGRYAIQNMNFSNSAPEVNDKDREDSGMTLEDFRGEQDAWSASNEDGWYYED